MYDVINIVDVKYSWQWSQVFGPSEGFLSVKGDKEASLTGVCCVVCVCTCVRVCARMCVCVCVCIMHIREYMHTMFSVCFSARNKDQKLVGCLF